MDNKETRYAKWLSGEISDEQLSALEGEDALAELKRVKQTVDQWSMPKYDTSAGYKKFKAKHPSKSGQARRINWFALSSIAATLLLLILAVYTFLGGQNEVVLADNGQDQKLSLSGGSEVWLNDGSSVEYNSKDWEDQRSISLTGEAQFDVTKGNEFIVHTQHGTIRVLGTQFNVRAWGENLYVECYEGRVEVSSSEQSTILVAQEAVKVVKGRMSEKEAISNTVPVWQNGRSRFYDEPLQIVCEELERQYNIKVNMSIQHKSFTGSFRHDDLEKALRSICKPLGLQFEISKDRKAVTIK